MKGTMTIIRATGAVEKTEITAQPGFKALQTAVGGLIETVPLLEQYEGQDCVAFCNEEGKLHGLPLNHAATALWQDEQVRVAGRFVLDVLLGDVVIIVGDDELLEAV